MGFRVQGFCRVWGLGFGFGFFGVWGSWIWGIDPTLHSRPHSFAKVSAAKLRAKPKTLNHRSPLEALRTVVLEAPN